MWVGCSVDAVGVLLALAVAVQVAEGLPVGELDLGWVVHGGPRKLKHRLLHVYRRRRRRRRRRRKTTTTTWTV